MPWEIRKELHLDIRAPYGRVLLASGTDSSLLQPPPDFVHGDKMPVRIHFWERGANGTLTAADPGATTTIVFTGRPKGLLSGTDLLFQATDFEEIEEGIWEGELDLTPAEFGDHLDEAPAGAKIITGEVEVRDATGEVKRLSLQFDLTARPQSYNNEDAPSSLPGPLDWLATNRTAFLAVLGIPTYADLAAANLALPVGRPYYDTALATTNTTTA
jgi:hypothetical protein